MGSGDGSDGRDCIRLAPACDRRNPDPSLKPPTAKVQVSFTYRDEKGDEKEAKGKLYLTESIHADG